jgi:hypothetical protein
MANGTGEQIFEETPVTAPDGSIIPVRHPKGANENTIKAFAAQEYYKTHPKPAQPAAIGEPGGELDLTDVAAQVDPLEFARAVPRGMVRGAAGTASFLGAMGRGEIEAASAPFGGPRDLPPAATTEQLTEPIAGAIERTTGGYIPMEKPTTPSGEAGQRVGEFLGDPMTWLGPGGPIRKIVSATLGGIGSYIGEKLGGTKGAVIGGVTGGAVGGFGAGTRGLPQRVPRAIRNRTDEEALRAASKAGYQQLEQSPFMMTTMEASQLRGAIENQLRADNFPDWLVSKTYKALEHLTETSAHPATIRQPGLITVGEVERVRQVLNKVRREGGNESDAASSAIEGLDDYLMNLPGVGEAAIQARGNWAAYKRGQMVEEAIRRGTERAKTAGTGANVDNSIKQEFRKLKNKKYYESSFTPQERAEIDRVIDPGVALDVARWMSRFSPRHIIPAALGLAGIGHLTGSTLDQLAMLTTGEVAKQYVTRMTTKRAGRLLEATRARSPAGGDFTPRPAIPATQRAGYGAARALGATALSPDVTERLELPEIVVKPQQ